MHWTRSSMLPIICLITDRRRAGSTAALIEAAHAAARAGVQLVQVRERDLDGRPLLDLVNRVLDAVRSTPARVVVNDRLDVALAAGAHGVHLRADSMPAPRIRSVVPPGFLVGRSVHGATEARAASAAGGLDYLTFGAVYATASKGAGHRAAGPAVLAEVAASTSLPVLAVGGITADRAGEVAAAGAMGVAAIGLFADAPAHRLPAIVGEMVRAFARREP